MLVDSDTFIMPKNLLALEPFFLSDTSPIADKEAFTHYTVSFTNNGDAILKDVIGQGPEAEIVRATWHAVYEHGHGTGQVVLTSPSVDYCKLGDLMVFCMAEMPLFMEGRLLGMCAQLVGQFGHWLDKIIHRLAPPCRSLDIPLLRGLVKARNLDVQQLGHLASEMAAGKLANQAQVQKHHGAMRQRHKVMVYLYISSLAKVLGQAHSKTLHVMVDGWRSVGEQMDLYFVFSPWSLVGGWLPFQVPSVYFGLLVLHY